MFRPFQTALLVAVFAGSAFGIASAAPSAPTHSLRAAAPRAAVDADGASETATQSADIARWSSGTGSALSTPAGDAASSPMRRLARGIVNRTSSIALNLTRNALRFVGTPYVFGGTSSSGFDCSGYVQHVFATLGIVLPRTADAQYFAGRRTVGGMRSGDLVFFETYLPGPSHVGIYIGSGKFVHSSGHGVMVSHLRDRYWSARYLGAKRVVAAR